MASPKLLALVRWLRFQHSLRTLLIVVTLLALFFAWFGEQWRDKQRERRLIAALRKRDIAVYYDSHIAVADNGKGHQETWVASWLTSLLGDDWFSHPSWAIVTGDSVDGDLRLLEELPTLTLVDLSRSQITDDGLKFLASLRNLENISLAPGVRGSGLCHLQRLDRLSSLDAHQLEDVGLKFIGRMKGLKYLDLSECRISDAGVACLRNLNALEELYLSETGLTDAGMVHIGALSNLRVLDISETSVTGEGLKRLNGMSKLESLFCWDLPLQKLDLRDLPALEEFFYYTIFEGEVSVEGLVRMEELVLDSPIALRLVRLPRLKTLDASETAGQLYLEGLDRLESVYIRGTPIGDAAIRQICKFESVVDIDLMGAKFTDDGLKLLVTLPNLQSLNLEMTEIVDESLKHLAKLTTLKRLDLDLTLISDRGLAYLGALRNLEVLDVVNTDVSDEGVSKLRKALPNCQINYY